MSHCAKTLSFIRLNCSRTHHLNGDREMAKYFDDQAIQRSGGKAVRKSRSLFHSSSGYFLQLLYKRTLQLLFQERSQQMQQQQPMMMNMQVRTIVNRITE